MNDLLQSEFENLIAERTRELEDINANLEEMNTELKEKNEELQEMNAQLKKLNEQLVSEVSLRQQTENRLKKAIEELQDIYDHAPCGYHSLDKDGIIIRINETELKWLGYPKEEVVGKKKFTDFITPESKVIFKENYQAYMQRGWVKDLEFEIVRPDHSTIAVLVSGTAVKDPYGNYIKSRSTVYDITEQKEIKRKLQEINQDLERIIFERTNQLQETNAELEELNAELEETNAQLEEEILERSIAEISLQKSEERYRGIYENSPLVIVLLDREFKIIDWNKRAEELFGWTKDEVIGRRFIDFMIPNESKNDISEIALHLPNTKFVRTTSIENITKDGNILFCEWHNTLLHDGQGNVIGEISLGLDKTEAVKAEKEKIEAQKQVEKANKYLLRSIALLKQEISERLVMEEALRKSKSEADQANLAKSQFLANMSHEIRTPMNGIIGMTDLLKYTILTNEQINMVNIIESSSKLLLNIINDILDLSKIEAGIVELCLECVDVNSLIHNKSNLLKAISTKKGLEIEVTIDNDVPRVILVDKTRLLQVINNLIGNSMKFTEKGKIKVSLKKIKEVNGKVELMFSVSDTGIGIKEEDIPKLFNNFTQLDSSLSKRYQGTGLGLAISKRLVELMDGEISVESEYGKGSTFYFTCWVAVPKKESGSSDELDIPMMNELSKPLNILLVEDDRVSQLILKQISKLKGWQLHVASTGEEALEIYDENLFDLMLLDIQMPGMSGYEVAQRIREIEKSTEKHIPIIATTAYAMSGDKERCLDTGMDDYISKPINIDRLNESIVRLTHQS